VYEGGEVSPVKGFKNFMGDAVRSFFGFILIIIAAQGIVYSAKYFSSALNLSLGLVGILIVGIGSSLPETYFAIMAAKKGETWMILGNIMGSVIIIGTLVLGAVALVCPIEVTDFSSYAVARIFLFIAAIMFFFCVRTNRKVTRGEALVLLFLYIAFLIMEILLR
jgi:cation:H+ antiporter